MHLWIKCVYPLSLQQVEVRDLSCWRELLGHADSCKCSDGNKSKKELIEPRVIIYALSQRTAQSKGLVMSWCENRFWQFIWAANKTSLISAWGRAQVSFKRSVKVERVETPSPAKVMGSRTPRGSGQLWPATLKDASEEWWQAQMSSSESSSDLALLALSQHTRLLSTGRVRVCLCMHILVQSEDKMITYFGHSWLMNKRPSHKTPWSSYVSSPSL